MTTLITIGIISLVGLCVLFICKSRELSGKSNPLGSINRMIEPYVLLARSFLRTIEEHLEPKRSKTLILYGIIHSVNKLLGLLRRGLGAVHYKFSTIAQVMQGREAVLKGGASSVFLKSIAEHKKKIQEEAK